MSPEQQLESPRRLSESMIWRLLSAFYESKGIRAWDDGIVPEGISSSNYTTDIYAALVAGFLRDLRDGPDHARPIVLEIGGGTGRFALRFLNQLTNHHFSRERTPPFDYLLTDGASSNVASWKESARLMNAVERGSLEIGQLRLGADFAIDTRSSGMLTADSLEMRPVVLVANYVLDAIPSDLIRVRDHELWEEHIALRPSENAPGGPLRLEEIIPDFTQAALKSPYSEYPQVNAVIAAYRSLAGDQCIPVPIQAIRFFERFLRTDQPFLMIAGDLAYTRPPFQAHPPLVFSEYVTCSVNFHMIGRLFQEAGGAAHFSRHEDQTFSVGAFLKPAGPAEFARTTQAARDLLRFFSPHDSCAVLEALEATAETLDYRQMIALMRLSRSDPESVLSCLPYLPAASKESEEFDRGQVQDLLMEAYRSELPSASAPRNLDLQIALRFLQMEMYSEATELLSNAMEERGRSVERLHLIALAHFRMGKRTQAVALLHEVLAEEPAYWGIPLGEGKDPLTVEQVLEQADEWHQDRLAVRAAVRALRRRPRSSAPSEGRAQHASLDGGNPPRDEDKRGEGE